MIECINETSWRTKRELAVAISTLAEVLQNRSSTEPPIDKKMTESGKAYLELTTKEDRRDAEILRKLAIEIMRSAQ